ncbi:Udp-glucose 6-dehydrogenase [Thalictrum thalictroides]|uniref:Udp-glucose 6-dehydrogenase n=1 Tax=Thalictrum thalictroides TaxID=46969 RepID=A0A7J6VN36_THATH|nr:Udp-glucose 6-dehydrogenase [Thalictrum thalictroides]
MSKICALEYYPCITMIVMAYECANVAITMLDVDNENLHVWEARIVPFEEPDMEHMYDQVHNVRLRIGHDIAATLNDANCIVMAIDNPIQKINSEHELNLTKWEASWRRVAIHAANKLLIEKSNVPIDADKNINRIFFERGAPNYPRVLYNPDFYSLGTSYMDMRFPSQVIFGGNSQLIHGVDFLQFRNLLYWVPDNILFTYPDSKSVIIAKLGINVLLAAKLSTLNNISSISAQVKANTHRIMDIMNRNQRLGPTSLKSGIGFRGPNLLRDTQYLSQVAHDNGLPEEKQLYVKILANNRTARRRFVKMVLAKLTGMKNKTIAIFGFASSIIHQT